VRKVDLEYFGVSAKLSRILSNATLLKKNYGIDRARRIIQRLHEIQQADNLSDIPHIPPPRLHKLQDERSNEFAVDIGANWRMVFVGYDNLDRQTTDKSQIVTIMILAIEDYH
jgi:proteic killer suppression protein